MSGPDPGTHAVSRRKFLSFLFTGFVADVAVSITSFCNEHKEDPDCGAAPAATAAQATARTPLSSATIILGAAAAGYAAITARRG